jgi:hypothetical protein
MVEEECLWFNKIPQELEDYLYSRARFSYESECEDDKMVFDVTFIQCIRLDEIEIKAPWNEQRVRDIKQWATPNTLNRLKIYKHPDEGIFCIDRFIDLPDLDREYDFKLPDNKQEKYKIGDGIHRINRARELGMDCILAQVTERVTLRKEDIQTLI